MTFRCENVQSADLGNARLEVSLAVRDEELAAQARAGAQALLDADPALSSKANKPLHELLRKRYARALELFRVG